VQLLCVAIPLYGHFARGTPGLNDACIVSQKAQADLRGLIYEISPLLYAGSVLTLLINKVNFWGDFALWKMHSNSHYS